MHWIRGQVFPLQKIFWSTMDRDSICQYLNFQCWIKNYTKILITFEIFYLLIYLLSKHCSCRQHCVLYYYNIIGSIFPLGIYIDKDRDIFSNTKPHMINCQDSLPAADQVQPSWEVSLLLYCIFLSIKQFFTTDNGQKQNHHKLPVQEECTWSELKIKCMGWIRSLDVLSWLLTNSKTFWNVKFPNSFWKY